VNIYGPESNKEYVRYYTDTDTDTDTDDAIEASLDYPTIEPRMLEPEQVPLWGSAMDVLMGVGKEQQADHFVAAFDYVTPTGKRSFSWPREPIKWAGDWSDVTRSLQREYDLGSIGRYIRSHYRRQAREHGVFHVARQLRKQGVPLTEALLILARR
jgi:hypothetical protein